MKKSNEIYLQDILNAINTILDEYIVGFDFDKFDKDKKTQDAVIRQIAIIGEALGKLGRDVVESHPELPTKEAVAMRNVLVHDYDWVDTKEVWKTIQKDLPELKIIADKILKEEY